MPKPFMVLLFIDKTTQKLAIPGPFITAPRMMFLPFLSVKRGDAPLSAIIFLFRKVQGFLTV